MPSQGWPTKKDIRYYVNKSQIYVPKDRLEQAVAEQVKYDQRFKEQKKEELGLWEEPVYYVLEIYFFQIPLKPHDILRPGMIYLPHPLWTPQQPPEVCCFVPDGRKKEFKNRIAENGWPIKKVYELKQLKKEVCTPEARRKLVGSWDMFFCSKSMMLSMPYLLNDQFYSRSSKFPIPLKLKSSQLGKAIRYALHCTTYHYDAEVRSDCRVGRIDNKQEEVVENVLAALWQISKLVPGGWDNIATVRLRMGSSPALPLYCGRPKELDKLLYPLNLSNLEQLTWCQVWVDPTLTKKERRVVRRKILDIKKKKKQKGEVQTEGLQEDQAAPEKKKKISSMNGDVHNEKETEKGRDEEDEEMESGEGGSDGDGDQEMEDEEGESEGQEEDKSFYFERDQGSNEEEDSEGESELEVEGESENEEESEEGEEGESENEGGESEEEGDSEEEGESEEEGASGDEEGESGEEEDESDDEITVKSFKKVISQTPNPKKRSNLASISHSAPVTPQAHANKRAKLNPTPSKPVPKQAKPARPIPAKVTPKPVNTRTPKKK